jgi:HK97 family phage prohead protease/HK97 family phage major capsid protein
VVDLLQEASLLHRKALPQVKGKNQMNKIFHLYSPLTVEKGSKKKGLRVAGYANTSDKDRSGDIIPANAWAKGVENYRKNPVLLYQHDHSKPIGRIEKIAVDKKGIFVEAYISEAAEKLHGVQTLIKDGALKSFSVGFMIKDAKYDRSNDVTMITDVELHEISVVSVPCNQESLFSIRKSFDAENEYESFKEELMNSTASTTEKADMTNLRVGITDNVHGHYHTFEVDSKGKGVTTYASHGTDHFHSIYDNNFSYGSENEHTHTIQHMVQPINDSPVHPENPRPMSPSEIGTLSVDNSVVLYSAKEETIVTEEVKEETKAVEDAVVQIVKDVQEHAESVAEEKVAITEETKSEELTLEKDEEDDITISDNPYELIPFMNYLNSETATIKTDDFVKLGEQRYKVAEIATAQNPNFEFLEVDLNGKSLDNTVTISAETLSVVNFWEIGTKFDLELVKTDCKDLTDSTRNTIKEKFEHLVNISEQDLFSAKDNEAIKNSSLHQEKLNRTLNILATPSSEWNDTIYNIASTIVNNIDKLKSIDCNDGKETSHDLALLVNGHETTKTIKENDKMATENAGDPIVLETETKAAPETDAPELEVSSAKVGDNQTEKLIEQTGETIIKAMDEEDRSGSASEATMKELESLRNQITEYKHEVKALTSSKMHYQEQERNASRFSEKELANAYLLSKALNRKDVFDTKVGNQIKAVTSVSTFLTNFSTNVYEEMEQQLVIAPMFERLAVDAKTFTIPIANEETDDQVAQFASGTYNTGVGDTTNVPTSNQHTISSVDFTPHKFMVTTHLAKDEEEDTILPLIDFLRRAATRRLSRSIDKAILRGTGALTGFTANPGGTSTYASVVKGLITMVNQVATDGLTVRTADGDTKASAANIASARALMGKYGLQLGDHLVYLTTIEGYNELVTTSDFRTVDKFGPNATYLTGSVGAVYGIPVVITEFLDNVGSNSAVIGSLVYKPGFMLAERRGIEIESEYEPRQQVTAMYLSTRFDFKALSTTGSGANVSTTYGYGATVMTLA